MNLPDVSRVWTWVADVRDTRGVGTSFAMTPVLTKQAFHPGCVSDAEFTGESMAGALSGRHGGPALSGPIICDQSCFLTQ